MGRWGHAITALGVTVSVLGFAGVSRAADPIEGTWSVTFQAGLVTTIDITTTGAKKFAGRITGRPECDRPGLPPQWEIEGAFPTYGGRWVSDPDASTSCFSAHGPATWKLSSNGFSLESCLQGLSYCARGTKQTAPPDAASASPSPSPSAESPSADAETLLLGALLGPDVNEVLNRECGGSCPEALTDAKRLINAFQNAYPFRGRLERQRIGLVTVIGYTGNVRDPEGNLLFPGLRALQPIVLKMIAISVAKEQAGKDAEAADYLTAARRLVALQSRIDAASRLGRPVSESPLP